VTESAGAEAGGRERGTDRHAANTIYDENNMKGISLELTVSGVDVFSGRS